MMKYSFRYLLTAFFLVSTSFGVEPKRITQVEIVKAIMGETSECGTKGVRVDHLEYFDFRGDGQEAAVVVAATCMTGTAGPDIHAVYIRNAAGNIEEMPFRRAEGSPFFSNREWDLPLFGNCNYNLTVEKGLLVARWRDSSDRESPLVIRYKWNGTAFVEDSREQEGPFTTSYDCAKATKEIELAICYSKSVAALDVELGTVYRKRLRNATPETKAILQEEQRKWLAERDSKCVIYKWWVDCLTDLYTKRTAELKSTGSEAAR